MPVSSDFIAGLADPDIIETLNVETIVTAMRDDLVVKYPDIEDVIDLESEPARMILEVCAFRELLVRARVNSAARANLIAFATGTDLDHLAAFYDVTRAAEETDTELRARTILSIVGRSPGGTEERYESIALAADPRVDEVYVCRCTVRPIVRVAITATDNGGVPDQPLLDAVQAALEAPAVRVISDTIVVESAVLDPVDVTADIWLEPTADNAVFEALEQTLIDAWAAYGRIGRDLALSWITKTLTVPGVARVDLQAPTAHTTADLNQKIAIGTVTLTNKGRLY